MTSLDAERTVLSGMLAIVRGLRVSRSPEVAQRAAIRERAILDELASLQSAHTGEFLFSIIDDPELATKVAEDAR